MNGNMETVARIRNPCSGGYATLMVHDTMSANDDITIATKHSGEVRVWRGDLPKLIRILQTYVG